MFVVKPESIARLGVIDISKWNIGRILKKAEGNRFFFEFIDDPLGCETYIISDLWLNDIRIIH